MAEKIPKGENVDKAREELYCYLEQEREVWLPLHHRDVRAGGNNAEAKQEAQLSMDRIDHLLDDLSRLRVLEHAEVIFKQS